MRPGARRVGAVSALTVVGIMTALTAGMASSTAFAAPSHSAPKAKGVHAPAQKRQGGVDLAVTKTGPASAAAGDSVKYVVTVTNNSSSPSSGYTVTDYLPAGIEDVVPPAGCSIPAPGLLTCTHGPLAAHGSDQIILTGTAGLTYTDLHNIVTVEGFEPDPDYSNNAAAVRTTVKQERVDLALAKYGPSSAPENSRVAYTLTVTNKGPDASSGWIINDQLPSALHGPYATSPGCHVTASNLLICEGGSLAPGASAAVTVTGTAGPGFNGVRNTATVRGGEFDPELGNNTAANQESRAALRITKTMEAPRTIREGDTVRYTVRVRNTGDMDFVGANPAHFTDDLTGLLDDARFNDDGTASSGVVGYAEPRLTWTGNLRHGDSVVIRYSITVNRRDFGDLRLQNGLVSDTAGSNCPTADASRECRTLGLVHVRDKDTHRATVHHTVAADRPRAARR
ncbi:DUF11 domain-containing protein [Streptomyces sp. NPDC004533]|uniref:DUF11 domain-containing protein n=1 Tax=Streptomyces sp. NPDC004533 TaxID=3154278 RepID=UPI0033B1A79C